MKSIIIVYFYLSRKCNTVHIYLDFVFFPQYLPKEKRKTTNRGKLPKFELVVKETRIETKGKDFQLQIVVAINFLCVQEKEKKKALLDFHGNN